MKKISILLGVLLTLLSFSGCNSSSEDTSESTSTEETTTTSVSDGDSLSSEFIRKSGTISDEYSELFHTWYSGYDIIAFTDDGEFYLTYDDIGYCISGTYTIEDGVINVTIDESSIKSSLMTVGNTSYKFKFEDGNLILTLADDETQSVTYYLDKSVALGESN